MKKPLLRGALSALCLLIGLCFAFAAPAQGESGEKASESAGREESLLLPDGREVPLNCRSLDLSTLSGTELEALLPRLPLLTAVKKIDLGEEREDAPDWEQLAALRAVLPQARLLYRFTLYGLSVNLDDRRLDLNHIPIEDRGELVRRVIVCMPRLEYLCMDSCGVSNEDMAAIRDDFPETEVIWRIWFGPTKVYSVRTDVIKILASKPSWGGEMTSEDVAPIRYCTKLKYLDLGHNENITDISFVRSMPDLEVFIIAMNPYMTDISPLADCPKLEYLELFMTGVEDLSPLAGLKELRHLNISECWSLLDLSPIYGLELERLYIGCLTHLPQEQIEEYRRLHPDCEVNDTLSVASQGTWRFTDMYGTDLAPRYALLREQFGYDALDYSVFWMDPNYY